MQRLFFRRSLAIKSGQRGWRQYLDCLKERPTSHVTAFSILPFPFISFPLKGSCLGEYLHIPIEYIQEGNKKINRVRPRYSFEPLEESSLVLVNLSDTYGVVKLLLLLCIGLCVMLTPWLASLINSSSTFLQRFKTKFSS